MRHRRRAAVLILLGLLAAAPAAAQGFGKNKVQYDALEWAVLETPHVRLHYYAEEESLARRLAVFAESVCVEFDARFRIEPKRRVPVLLYSHHHLFQQTNAAAGLISEGTGGLTELIKGRVLIPHTGSWARLRWVTRHELAHAYMLEKLARVTREHRRSQSYLPPLWFIEGLAEYVATGWDEESEGLMRDAATSGNAWPVTRSEPIYGTVLMYKEGHDFLLYLARRFGPDRVFDLLDQWWRADDFETVFHITFGVPLAEVDEAWFQEVRRRWYPAVADHARPDDVALRLTRSGRFNLGPRALPGPPGPDSLARFVYFTAGVQGTDLMLSEPGRDGRRRVVRLLRGGQSPQFESLHLFQNRPDASPEGLVAFSSKRGGRDALYLLDARTRRVERRLEFPTLVAINDPSLAPGARAVVFSGMDYGGRKDLYRARWDGDRIRLERLTHDAFDDVEPDVSPDGRWVTFASDRADRGGRYSLFRLSLETGAVEALGDPMRGDDRQPAYSPDGRWIAFRSTRGGTSDLWVRSAEPSREARRVTRLLGPASDPDWLPDGRGLLFTAQSAITFHTYALAFDPDTLRAETEGDVERAPALPVAAFEGAPQRYQRQLGLDLVQNGFAIDPGVGGVGGGQVALSDVLGNEALYIYLSNDSERFGDFWDGFEGSLTYVNQSRRLNYGIGTFRLTQTYDADIDVIRREKRSGVLVLASYPFSKFLRVEGSVVARHASQHRLRDGRIRSVDLISNVLSVTHDNARWTALGPSAGSRVLLAAGVTRDLTSGEGDYGTLLSELRVYRMPWSGLVSATRVQGQASLGRDAQTFYLGGFTSLRGFDRRALAGEQTLLVQQELRFPVLRGLTFAIPTPWAFPTVNAAAFGDAAWAWNGREVERLGSLGVGAFIGGGYFPAIRWNYAWVTRDFATLSLRPRTQFAIGFLY
uniref:Bacterial surface antigen (D15) domain-containing protein n=1 Tax=Eiseniibacteriota bacterium TaxID=2212470 RepID=A0A832HZK3_UNCEI